MENPYLKTQNDGLFMRPARPWTPEKLDYLARYLVMFTTSMRERPWRALNYIDLFAGPGKCQEDNGNVSLGSPLLALTTQKPFDNYFFVDWDPTNIQTLQQRCQPSPYADRIQYFPEDCNVAVHHIAEKIQCLDSCYLQGQWSCLNLAFLDPEGLEVQWETVKALAQLRTDLIIHYSQMGLERYMPIAFDNLEETIVDRFFGSRDWRVIYQELRGKTGLHRQLIDFYKQNLQRLGYVEIKDDGENWTEPLMRNTKNAPLYRLLFASKHPLGETFWREVNKHNVHGQGRLF